MILKLEKPIKIPDGKLVRAISGNRDGSFSIVFDGENFSPVVRFYDRDGKVCYPMSPYERASYLSKAYAKAFKLYRGNDFNNGYFKEEIFPNGWSDVRTGEHRFLVNEDFEPVVTDYDSIHVFNCGMVISDFRKTKSQGTMLILDLKGRPLRMVSNIVTFLGDGCYLAEKVETGVWTLFNFAGVELSKKPVTGCELFFNGSFVLTFDDGCQRYYHPDGTVKTVETKDATVLPDGCFIQRDEYHQISGIYSPNGIMDRRSVYRFQKTDDYYLISGEQTDGLLYDSTGNLLGKRFKLVKAEANFAFFERDNWLYVFNQFGKVLSGKYCDEC